jgi:flavocytochrome c
MNRTLESNRKSQITWDESFDVIVIGSGFAGLAAAVEAHNAGATVLVIEKMKAVGGNSVISDGGIAAPQTNLQKKFHIEDSPDLMFEDMMRAGLHLNDPALVRVVVEGAKDAFEWSCNYLGVEYMDRVDIFGGHSALRCYTAKNVSGSTIIKKQEQKLRELKIPIRLSTRFSRFVQEPNGRVCGVVVQEGSDEKDPMQGREKTIKANRAVILASGGFGADIAFRSSQDPRLTKNIDTTNKPFATAQALKEALRIGAASMQLSQIQLGPWASPDEKGYGDGPQFSEYIVFQYGLLVDPSTGKRFINELADRKTLSDRMLSLGHPCVGIADAAAVGEAGWDIDRALIKGVVRTFDTLGELAYFYGISIKHLEKSIKAFNSAILKRKDTMFGKPILENAIPLTRPPYYGMRLWPKVHHTMGGVRINPMGQIIDLDGNAIAGLFAAGEVTGGVHGACRLGSCAITDCLVFGRIAGRNAANTTNIE